MPAPFLLSFSELAQWTRFRADSPGSDLRGSLQAVAQRRAIPPELQGRTFMFLVHCDRELSEDAADQATDAMLRLLCAFPGSRALIVCEENSLSMLRSRLANDSRRTEVLVVRPMEWPPLKQFLLECGPAELAEVLEERQISDLASAPWILARLRDFAHGGRFANNRAEALGMIAASWLSGFSTQFVSRGCAEQALEKIAWEIQMRRTKALDNATLLPILAGVRDNRDFRLSDLRDELIRCAILAPSGEEGVRFSYGAMQAYYAARYLSKSPRMMELLEDISASLGRFSRMRHWENVLITLAGLVKKLDDRVRLLQVILAGSSLAEGEQAYLAVCMYMEMADEIRQEKGAKPERRFLPQLTDHKVVRQIIDALIWRSRPDIPRPYADRRLAASRLADMRHPEAIRHLISLAADRFRIAAGPHDPNGDSGTRYDNAGIRLVAVSGLLRQVQETENYVRSNRPELSPLIEAWWKLAGGDSGPMIEILRSDDPGLSPLAAFALALAGIKHGAPPLLETFFYFEQPGAREPNQELLWAITEVFGRQDAAWLLESVVLRWLRTDRTPNHRLCYLIQRSGSIPPDSPVLQYLDDCLKQDRFVAHARALRAYSKLNDTAVNAWLIPLCEDIVRGRWEDVLRCGKLGLKPPLLPYDQWRMQQAALEVLRDIGNDDSITVVRDSRLSMDPILFQLSFQVAEEIYWRLTGGLAREDFTTATA